MRRSVDHGEVRVVPTWYRPRRWRVRPRLKFLITRPRLRGFADRHGLIVGVVDARLVKVGLEHQDAIMRAFWYGEPQVFVDGQEVPGVVNVKLTLVEEIRDATVMGLPVHVDPDLPEGFPPVVTDGENVVPIHRVWDDDENGAA